jgi:hypothetical protein
MKLSTRVLLVAVVVVAGQGLSSCSRSSQLPEGPRDALIAYWESLPSDPGVEHRIIRAWPGVAPEAESTPVAPIVEIWCVEAEMSAEDPAVDGSLLVWIVTRGNQETPWSAALLASLSSTWPYEACEEAS